MNSPLRIVPFPGIHADSLGHYLMALGLLRAASSRWPETRGVWREGVFYLVGQFTEANTLDGAQVEVTRFLHEDWQPTPFTRWWGESQESDKGKVAHNTWRARSQSSVADVRIGDCVLFPVGRNLFNPLFGSGGNVGRRDFEKGWKHANELRTDGNSRNWLRTALFDENSADLPTFKIGGTWFTYDSERFNSGLSWSKDGALSPWSFLLAMEGAFLLRGGSGRRLSARAQPYAVFPFTCQAAQPESTLEIGKKGQHGKAEFWAPMWEYPMLLSEVRSLFQRGLARVGTRAVRAPHEFAVAAISAGADAGVSGFMRFELRKTTSSEVFESLPRGMHRVPSAGCAEATSASALLMEFLGPTWLDGLPAEPRKQGTRTKYRGLRGPLERLILAVGREPENPETWQALLLRLAETQAGVDRNLDLRKTCRALPPLSLDWLRRLFRDGMPLPVRIAAALASLGSNAQTPAVVNVFGIEVKGRRRQFVRAGRPRRVVWHEGNPLQALLDLVERRLIDARTGELQCLASTQTVSIADVAEWLVAPSRFAEEAARWLPALSLLDWSHPARVISHRSPDHPPGPELLLWSFFKPFFAPFGATLRERKFFRAGRQAKPAFARQLLSALRQGAVAEAISLTATGYRAESLSPILPAVPSRFDADGLAVALAVPVAPRTLGRLVERWLEPSKQNLTTRTTTTL